MPYITNDKRSHVNTELDALVADIKCCGEDSLEGVLNYVITRLLLKSFDLDDTPRYHKINRAVGTLECVKQELYRRLAGPYEDKAIDKNGDIPEYK